MADRKTKCRRVSFYQIVKQEDGDSFPGLNWQQVLARITPSTATHTLNNRDIRGEVFQLGQHRYLELDVERDLAPRQRDRSSNKRAPLLTNGDSWEVIEESFVAFFEHNVVGMVSSNQSAPSHAALAGWLNRTVQPQERYYAKPIVSREMYHRLSEMRGVSLATFALKPSNASGQASGLLGSMLGAVEGIGPGVRVELRVVAGKSRDKPESRRLLEETLEINGLLREGNPFGIEKAVVNGIPANGGSVEPINLIEQRLTMDREVLIAKEEGKGLDETSAIDAIREAEDHLRDQLHAAIGVPVS
ncbi:hypothetical protein HCA61_03750 [Rhodococcus sp. HNM0563]|uniref:hypothetical protein n=1 Tax=Rhodococcus sp. HNM0563 TaxID=2716339 RepID=UPI00146C08F0|nr:hypothetical protein [Rhodococcus sp. HNM0563]NLU61374.1 hypothetical protein [Rhodococcus sp. HNM0563]